jgi:hypothetical protein
MSCTRIKKYNCGLIVYSKCTHHEWCTLRKFGESCKIHPPLANLHNLLLALALAVWIGRLPLE